MVANLVRVGSGSLCVNLPRPGAAGPIGDSPALLVRAGSGGSDTTLATPGNYPKGALSKKTTEVNYIIMFIILPLLKREFGSLYMYYNTPSP